MFENKMFDIYISEMSTCYIIHQLLSIKSYGEKPTK